MLGIKDVGASGGSDIDSEITFSKAEWGGDVGGVFSNSLAGTKRVQGYSQGYHHLGYLVNLHHLVHCFL